MAYRNIEDKIWQDPKFKTCDPQAKLVFVYLITNPHGHLSGIYCLPKFIIQHETMLTEAQLEAALDTLSIGHLAQYDHETEVVWVTNMLKYQGSGAKVLSSVAKQLGRVHNSRLISDFLAHYAHLTIPFKHTPSIPPGYPIEGASPQEQIQEQEQSRRGTTELNREGETPTAALPPFVPPDERRPKQTPTQMILDLALTRDATAELFERYGRPPWTPDQITAARAWLEPLKRFTEAELDRRRRARQAARPRGDPTAVADLVDQIQQQARPAQGAEP